MSMQLPQPPAATWRAVLHALDLSRLAAAGGRPRHTPSMVAAAARSGPLTPFLPLPVYVLDLGAGLGESHGEGHGSAGDGPLAVAPEVGWRFLVRGGEDEILAAADTVDGPDGPVVTRFTEGPYPRSTLPALRAARLLTDASAATYAPRLLSVPGRYMIALWLHAGLPAEGPEVLIPLSPAPLGVTANRPYLAGELLERLASGRYVAEVPAAERATGGETPGGAGPAPGAATAAVSRTA